MFFEVHDILLGVFFPKYSEALVLGDLEIDMVLQ